jgi:CheY-like chemotaxis protein
LNKDTILIVDDNAFNIFTAKGLIKRNFEVTFEESYNGEQAIKRVLARPKDNFFKAIIMDCSMPIMDGF